MNIYENQVLSLGSNIDELAGEDFIIMFGDGAPEELKSYCYNVSVNPIHGEIKPGQTLSIGDMEYKITAVGDEAVHTLTTLGHCTIRFTGLAEAEMPGSIYVEKKEMPVITVGTKIQIAA